MEIRPYLEADEPAVIAIWQACNLTRPWNDPRKDIARKLAVHRELFLVGEIDGSVVATVKGGYDGHRGWVNYLAVHPDFQRRRYGEAMMRQLELCLQDAGCPKINLQVRSTNTDVLEFYSRIGYAQDDVVSLGKRLVPDGPGA